MRRYCRGFKYTEEFVKNCIHDCLKNKWKRKDVSRFFAEYTYKFGLNPCGMPIDLMTNYLNEFIIIDKDRMKNQLGGLIDIIARDICYEINEKLVEFDPIVYTERYDKSSNKIRLIGKATIKQQIFDYIAVKSCEEMLKAKIGYYQCASIKGKGPLFGKKTIEKWIQKKPESHRYYIKCDIRKCYQSIDQKQLKRLLRRDIKNEDVIYVLETLMNTYKEGLCIGSYLSQYLANYYLSYLYHFITEQCHDIVVDTLFYMDDIVIFSNRKSYLSIAFDKIKDYLVNMLHLSLKSTVTMGDITKGFLDMMGYKFYRHKVSIRKKIFKKARKLLLMLNRSKRRIRIHVAKTFISYYGYIKYTDNFKLVKRYKVNELIKRAVRVISDHDSRIYRKAAYI